MLFYYLVLGYVASWELIKDWHDQNAIENYHKLNETFYK